LPVILSRALQHIVDVDGVRVDGDRHHLGTWATRPWRGWVGCSDGVDRSGPALAALGLPADVAAALGGSLMVMEVIEYVPPFPLGSDTAGTGAAEAMAAARARLAAVTERGRRPPIRVPRLAGYWSSSTLASCGAGRAGATAAPEPDAGQPEQATSG
jgi:hypothetical protein